MKESAEMLNNRALIFEHEGQTEESLACLKRAATIEPFNPLIWFNLGITLKNAGRLNESKNALEKAHSLNEDDEEILNALAVATMDAGDIDAALALCAKGLSQNELNPRLWNTFGVIYFKKDDLELASEAFEHAVTINPYYYDALFNLRDTYDSMGNAEGKARCEIQMQSIKNTAESV